MEKGQVSSDEARRSWRELLNAVEHNGEQITVLRYDIPAAVVVPVEWYRNALAVGLGVRAFTHDTDGHRLPGDSELPVGELLRLIGDEAIKELER
jgi:antitoxin (DNA-binding transcriptional repressor) of toxin-antitoxin stability system